MSSLAVNAINRSGDADSQIAVNASASSLFIGAKCASANHFAWLELVRAGARREHISGDLKRLRGFCRSCGH